MNPLINLDASSRTQWFDARFADAELEAAFQRDGQSANMAYARNAFIMVIALFIAFGAADIVFAPQAMAGLLAVRAAVVAILLGLYAFARRPAAETRFADLMLAAGLVIDVGYALIVLLAPAPLREPYADAALFVVMGLYIVLRLDVKRSLLVVLLAVVLFDIAYAASAPFDATDFALRQFLVLSAVAIGLFGNYTMERQRRMAYAGRLHFERQAVSLERALRQAAEAQMRAEHASRVKSDFVAHVSHELRTPLNAVIGFSEIMEGGLYGPLGDPRYLEYVRDIRLSGEHLLSLINDILDLSKIEAGRLDLHHEVLDAETLVDAAVLLVSGLALARRTRILPDLPASLPPLYGDGRALKQVLVNLLSNAVKFGPDDATVTLIVRPTADGKRVSFMVCDNGPGMTAEQLRMALIPFGNVSGSVAQPVKGSGLGLALSNRLAELHGAPLEIDSAPGRGTRVTFSVPVAAAVPPAQ